MSKPRPRVVISGRRLAVVIGVWLRSTPEAWWGKDEKYEKLRAEKRHNPNDAPNRRRDVADLIAAKLDKLGWEVSYEEPQGPFDAGRRNAD